MSAIQPKYHLEIRVDMDGDYTGQAYYGGSYLSGSTFISKDKAEVEDKLRRWVKWYDEGGAQVEVIEL